ELGVKGLPSNLGEERGVKGLPSNLGEELKGYEGLKGVMIGRGLLARPWMIHTPPPCGSPSPNLGEELVRQMHERVYRHATEHLCGDSQILSRLHAFWEYVDIPHKQKKAIMKAATLPRYREAVASAISCRPYGAQ
ncbi:MAG: tRNA-dihydrouridine synthase, partial [Bacteroidales bacterium]|nr:tRNA-dihydrouridine synthase [Bacteroidales bacterium]